jgi:hypothetical protein
MIGSAVNHRGIRGLRERSACAQPPAAKVNAVMSAKADGICILGLSRKETAISRGSWNL